MWRWSLVAWCLFRPHLVFSTYVEVILSRRTSSAIRLGILHVCGGDPLSSPADWAMIWYSPRMWRWSLYKATKKIKGKVFSTYVEVILIPVSGSAYCSSILHVCGGDPLQDGKSYDQDMYSPRMWRWSCLWRTTSQYHWVFSTYVEVILDLLINCLNTRSILHVCGGDPLLVVVSSKLTLYSPRMWRWSYQSWQKLR